MKMLRIFVDFNNADNEGRVRLTCQGTINDLMKKNIELEEGLEVILDDYDTLSTPGIVRFRPSAYGAPNATGREQPRILHQPVCVAFSVP